MSYICLRIIGNDATFDAHLYFYFKFYVKILFVIWIILFTFVKIKIYASILSGRKG
jgi:hypothetical protein